MSHGTQQDFQIVTCVKSCPCRSPAVGAHNHSASCPSVLRLVSPVAVRLFSWSVVLHRTKSSCATLFASVCQFFKFPLRFASEPCHSVQPDVATTSMIVCPNIQSRLSIVWKKPPRPNGSGEFSRTFSLTRRISTRMWTRTSTKPMPSCGQWRNVHHKRDHQEAAQGREEHWFCADPTRIQTMQTRRLKFNQTLILSHPKR